MLNDHLRRIGMNSPKDGAMQYQIALLQQWCDHLEAVLDDNGIDRVTAIAIIRQMIYGATPQAAEAELRIQVSKDYRDLLERTDMPRVGG